MQPVCPSNTLILAVIFGVQCGIIAVAYNPFFLKVRQGLVSWICLPSMASRGQSR